MRNFSIQIAVGLTLAVVANMSPGAAPTPAKYHPGHYVALVERQEIRDIQHLDEPALQGVSRRYYWAELEPKKGAYNFAGIRDDLALLKQHHKQLVVFITDKTFQPGKNPLPEYLASYALPNLRGFTAMRWDPVVIERFIALNEALARAFDPDPNFEGVAIQESALMINPESRQQHGYTPEKYRDALKRILTASSKAFGASQVFWHMNHLEDNDEYLGQVAQAIVGTRVAMGGPDILPYRRRLQPAYRLYEKFNCQLTLFCSAQDDSYRHDKSDSRNMATAGAAWNRPPPADGYVPMEQIFAFARDTLRVRYLFWSYKYDGGGGAFTYDDALAVMRAHPNF